MTTTQWTACLGTANVRETDHTQESLLLEYRPWLMGVAKSFRVESRTQDLAQEGWIEMWRRLHEDTWNKRLPLDLALKLHAKDRMRSVCRNWQSAKNQTGSSLDMILQNSDRPDHILEEIGLTTSLAEIEWAYHHGEIHHAICEILSPREREYVVLRFWCGYQASDLTAHFGYHPAALWRTARVKLRQALFALDPGEALICPERV